MEILTVKNITKTFGGRGIKFKALDGIDLKVDRGEFLGIMGPSGAGKTTLLNMLSTVDEPSSGEVIISGIKVSELKNNQLANLRKEKIGFIFQDFNLLDNLSIEDNIALPLALGGVHHKEITDRVFEICKFFGIEDHMKKYPYELSGGQKQRSAAARALISSPEIIFADEPTGALDSKSSSELLKCLQRVNKEYNTTIVMVTHDPLAASYSDRVMFLKDGRIDLRIDKNDSRSEFYSRIMDILSKTGGDVNERI